MILLALLVVAFFLSLLLGGRVEHLAQVKFRHSYLILLALVLQVLVFSTWWQERVARAFLTDTLYMLSMLLLVLAIWLNRRVAGITLLGSGLLLNTVAILVNGGHMPTSLWALRTAGIVDPQATFESIRATNSSLIDGNTPLWFLGDVFAIPKQIPLANIFSVGDVLIEIGGIWFIYANMRPSAPSS